MRKYRNTVTMTRSIRLQLEKLGKIDQQLKAPYIYDRGNKRLVNQGNKTEELTVTVTRRKDSTNLSPTHRTSSLISLLLLTISISLQKEIHQ